MNKIIDRKSLKKWSTLAILVFTITKILSLLPPLIMQKVIDEFIPNQDIKGIIFGIILFVSIPAIYILSQILFNYFSIKFARNKGNDIAMQITKNIVNQDLEFFDRQNSVELVTNSSKEATGYINFYISELPMYYGYIFISVIILIILCTYSPYIALVQLLFIPLAIWPIRKMTSTIQNQINRVMENNAKISQKRVDIFKAIGLVKSYRLEDEKIKEVAAINSDTASIWGKVAALDSTSGIWISGFLSMLFTGITFTLSALFIIKDWGNLTTGALISIISYTSMLYGFIDIIFKMQINKQKQDAEFSRLLEYIDLSGESQANEHKRPLVLNNAISLENITFKYPNTEKEVLENVSMNFEIGKWTGIVGESGIGKSTIFDLILAFYKTDKGNILFDGVNIEEISSFSIRENITRVYQDIFMFPGTIRENLLLGKKNISDDKLEECLKIANIYDFVKSLENGLDTNIGEAGKLISGGERQRLALAQALIRGNKILLLDEISSNIDINSENIIKENLNKLVREEGYTIISISHNSNFLEYSDKCYDLNKI